MTTITEFVRARLWDDEHAVPTPAESDRVVRELEGKRQMLALALSTPDRQLGDGLLRSLAHTYAVHIDFQPEWAM
ncbi:DUF6221 family protein [Nocardia sp. NPDC050793]|uniref:DUF6221 family protein n=1 Tax=Nocardia sp. NPDC050793 TaxID=3155159 RepID=UPI0033EF82FE